MGIPMTNTQKDIYMQEFSDLLSSYQGSSERLPSHVEIHCKKASKDFEYLNVHPCSQQWILAGP